MPAAIRCSSKSCAIGGARRQRPRLARRSGAAWLNHLVESRVPRLPTEQAELVRIAAVIGNVIPAWLLSRSPASSKRPAGARARRAGFPLPRRAAGTLRFKHGITRDVIYESVGLRARRALHLRIAEALQRTCRSRAGRSARGAGLPLRCRRRAAQAAHYAEMAGDQALAASALDRARAQYRAALAALEAAIWQPNGARWLAIVQRSA